MIQNEKTIYFCGLKQSIEKENNDNAYAFMNNIQVDKPIAAIFVLYYKEGHLITNNNLYYPLMAGNVMVNSTAPWLGDDTGDNISAKNRYYSELTGIYWAWKNTSFPIYGFCHYRRFFTCKPISLMDKIKQFARHPFNRNKSCGLIYTSDIEKYKNLIISYEEIEQILAEYDVILPVQRQFKYSTEEHYIRYHRKEDLQTVRNILKDNYPDFLDSFNKVMSSNTMYANNMYILKQADSNSFNSWWFSILFEFEKRTDLSIYQSYQQRIFGFMAERLLTVWFRHHSLKIKELPVLYFKNLKFDMN